jgi:hypothetical protein
MSLDADAMFEKICSYFNGKFESLETKINELTQEDVRCQSVRINELESSEKDLEEKVIALTEKNGDLNGKMSCLEALKEDLVTTRDKNEQLNEERLISMAMLINRPMSHGRHALSFALTCTRSLAPCMVLTLHTRSRLYSSLSYCMSVKCLLRLHASSACVTSEWRSAFKHESVFIAAMVGGDDGGELVVMTSMVKTCLLYVMLSVHQDVCTSAHLWRICCLRLFVYHTFTRQGFSFA